jgi:hypothetical protein
MKRNTQSASLAPAGTATPVVKTTVVKNVGVQDEAPYFRFLGKLQTRFQKLTDESPQLFTTDVSGTELWALYLKKIPVAHRQHNTCHSCRQFIERFGNLVLVAEDGTLTSPIWDASLAPADLRAAVAAVQEKVEGATVNGVFLSSERVWGTPKTGFWRHLSVTPRIASIYQGWLLTTGQRMAELREDFRCLQTALSEFPKGVLAQARTILEAEALARSEKFLGVVEWLEARQKENSIARSRKRSALLWRAVAAAPAGFCKPRSSMVGTLLEDLISGLSFADVKARFNAKMHPLAYQRPQAAPAAGNIRRAEEIFERLGLEASLKRRFATPQDVLQWLWQPRPARTAQPSGTGVFGHLTPKGGAPTPAGVDLPQKTMTWAKFRDTILPMAEKIELEVPSFSSSFSAFVTATDPDAPGLLQWDKDEARNPVSWYFYSGGKNAREWSLGSGGWRPVVGLTLKPNQWQPGFAHQGEAVMWVLEGCRDLGNSSLALFPECLKSDLHEVRATLEAYSQNGRLQTPTGQLASGMMFSKDNQWGVRVRVTSKGNRACYLLDRWD